MVYPTAKKEPLCAHTVYVGAECFLRIGECRIVWYTVVEKMRGGYRGICLYSIAARSEPIVMERGVLPW